MPKQKKVILQFKRGRDSSPLSLPHAQKVVDLYKKKKRENEISFKGDNYKIGLNGEIEYIGNKGANKKSE